MKLFFYLILLLLIFPSNNCVHSQTRTTSALKNEALLLMKDGRYGEAIDLLNKYVSSNPQTADGFNLRGICYEKRGNYEYAVYDFRTAKKISPDDKEIISNLNRTTQNWYKLLFNKIEGYKREIAINPGIPRNYLEIGKSYKNLGEWQEAEVWYDTYLEKEEASADEIIRYSEILAKNNHIRKGEPILKHYTEKYLTDHRLWSRYGYFVLWLGKNRLAADAFTRALEIRPYFKEALDGLDLAKGKGYIYSINDTTSKFNYGLPGASKVYIIDKYYRTLKNNPGDDETRFSLVNELMKANRYEEALDQLKILSPKFSDTKRFIELWEKVNVLREAYYADKIKEYESILQRDPMNKKILMGLGKYYSYQGKYYEAISLYKNYLNSKPADDEVRFKLAQIYTWMNNLCDAKYEADLLLKNSPNNKDYQLFAARIRYWINQNLDEAEVLYSKVIGTDAKNMEALTGLAYLHLRKNDIAQAENLISRINTLDINNQDYPLLTNQLEILKRQSEESQLNLILQEARRLVYEEKAGESIKYFNQYLSSDNANQLVYLELANAYLSFKDYKNAITIYDRLLKNNYDYDIDKQRAKVLFWEGDSISALKEFKRIVSKNPNDIEAKLYLGDAYLKNQQVQNARKIYEELLAQSPGSHILKTRLSWLGGSSKFAFENFPTYIQVIPQAFYFTDNLDFELNTQGVGIELGATSFLSLGLSGYRGNLTSDFSDLRFNQFKGSAYFRFSNFVRAAASFGKTYFVNSENENITEVSLTAEKKNNYTISAYLNFSDAAFILYSPFLVDTRLGAYLLGLTSDYKFKNGLVLAGKFQYVDVSDNNSGNQLQLRLGKMFEEDFSAGYEYYYYSFDQQVNLYWSPDNFESHSLWADWNLLEDESTSIKIGGKVGLIPQNDFVVTEFFGAFSYKFTSYLSFDGRISTGSSSRSNIGYRSASFQAGLFWNL